MHKNRISHKPSVAYQPDVNLLGDKLRMSRQMVQASNSGPISANRYRKSKIPEQQEEGLSEGSGNGMVLGIEVKVEDLKQTDEIHHTLLDRTSLVSQPDSDQQLSKSAFMQMKNDALTEQNTDKHLRQQNVIALENKPMVFEARKKYEQAYKPPVISDFRVPNIDRILNDDINYQTMKNFSQAESTYFPKESSEIKVNTSIKSPAMKSNRVSSVIVQNEYDKIISAKNLKSL